MTNEEIMSQIESGARVLRRTDRNPHISMLLVGYDETKQSFAAVHPDGVEAPTVVSSSTGFQGRYTKLGWIDVTGMWETPAETEPMETKTATASGTKTKKVRRVVRKKSG